MKKLCLCALLLCLGSACLSLVYAQNALAYYTTLQIVTGRQVIKIPTQLQLNVIRDAYGNVADVTLSQHQTYAVVGVGSDTVQLTNGTVTSLSVDTNAQGFVDQ